MAEIIPLPGTTSAKELFTMRDRRGHEENLATRARSSLDLAAAFGGW
jgi:hypothetical protein